MARKKKPPKKARARKPRAPAIKAPIPFAFVLELLEPAGAYTKPFFGCTAVYVDDKIVLLLRDREEWPEDNGVSVATFFEHHDSLREELPSLRSLTRFGPEPTHWQHLPSDSDDFEAAAERVCALIVARDPRIGRVPKASKAKRPKKRDFEP